MRTAFRFFMGAALLATFAAPAIGAQPFPSKPVRIVVGFPPGGGADFAARAIQTAFSKALNQQVYIDNRAGANGTIGASTVARAEPDGYTVFVTTAGTVALSPTLMKGAGFNPLTDFAPVGRVVSNTTIFVLNPSIPSHDIRQLIANARTSGHAPVIASSGNGSIPHMAIELLSAASELPITHVPYRGAGPALTDTVGGQVQGFVADVPVVLQYIKSGRLRAAGVAGARRSPVLPDVPTLAEQGFANTNAENWYGMFAPAGTPDETIAILNRALVTALKDPETQAKLAASGVIGTPSTPRELDQLLQSEVQRWKEVIETRGITVD